MFAQLKNYCKENNIICKENEPMCDHTTFKIGGNADLFVCIKNKEQLKEVIKMAKEQNIPLFMLGLGSNLLVSDKGINGVVVSLQEMKKIKKNNNTVTAEAGAPLSKVCTFAQINSLGGLEFAFGIPGSVGGALYMNAGAYGGEMKDVVLSAECINENGEFITLTNKEMELGYRTSAFKKSGYVILSVTFCLKAKDSKQIMAEMEDYASRRRDKQPLEYPSAGSTFKRPEGHFAGALIEQNGLKGFTVGGAQVSEKHAGFVINKGGATATDVKNLINQVAEKVYKNNGVKLEPEVIFVGRE